MDKQHPIGQGHGIQGRFAGLPDKFAHKSSAKIVILPVPFDKTSTYQKGSENGPEAIIEASRNLELYDIETGSEVYRKGIYTDDAILEFTSEEMLESTYRRIKNWIVQDKFVVTIGGEHSISYAAIRAHAEHYGLLTVVQFDAHADLQTSYEDNPWSHACVMARVKELSQVIQIVSVGIRSMSSEELENLDPPNTFFAHEIACNPAWMDQVLAKLQGPIYITFDVDVFDSGLMPSTGTPEPGGLQWDQVMTLFKRIAQTKKVVGFDVMELCPFPYNLAPDYLTAKLIYKFLSFKFFPPKTSS